MAWTSSIYDHFPTFNCDLDLQLTWTNVSDGTSTPQEEQLCQLSLKCSHKCWSNGLDKLNLWPFYCPTFNCDLALQLTWTNVSDGTSTSRGEQLCQISLKYSHKCRINGSDKLNLWPFYFLTFNCDLDLQVWPWPLIYLNECFKRHFYSSRRPTVLNNFEIHTWI